MIVNIAEYTGVEKQSHGELAQTPIVPALVSGNETVTAAEERTLNSQCRLIAISPIAADIYVLFSETTTVAAATTANAIRVPSNSVLNYKPTSGSKMSLYDGTT